MSKKKTEKKTAPSKAETKPSKSAKPSAASAKPKASSRQPRPASKESAGKSPAAKASAAKSGKASAPTKVIESFSETVVVTDDQIATHAYYISEHRVRNGHPGDALSDWLEAERQLRGR